MKSSERLLQVSDVFEIGTDNEQLAQEVVGVHQMVPVLLLGGPDLRTMENVNEL